MYYITEMTLISLFDHILTVKTYCKYVNINNILFLELNVTFTAQNIEENLVKRFSVKSEQFVHLPLARSGKVYDDCAFVKHITRRALNNYAANV